MMPQHSTFSATDARAIAARRAVVLHDARLPDAPLVMPAQVIEAPFVGISGVLRLFGDLVSGFGRAARGR
ncbi:hypothetical protein [Puniceibacterium sp. IMCC21224]|uniref:hypothetical protein n=1 Tax=Puniceibacterium sp. IMCC21224 TaxID=1618204 RepID=UPI00065D1F06|nr:hypothetical protein [Puniceibacterium sp. IMCC21224]KMK66827.1 hypothetical protein IMCC21224_111684 [Puniceibacterium sp. IMCC21224]